jgi:hypothetical protein
VEIIFQNKQIKRTNLESKTAVLTYERSDVSVSNSQVCVEQRLVGEAFFTSAARERLDAFVHSVDMVSQSRRGGKAMLTMFTLKLLAKVGLQQQCIFLVHTMCM